MKRAAISIILVAALTNCSDTSTQPMPAEQLPQLAQSASSGANVVQVAGMTIGPNGAIWRRTGNWKKHSGDSLKWNPGGKPGTWIKWEKYKATSALANPNFVLYDGGRVDVWIEPIGWLGGISGKISDRLDLVGFPSTFPMLLRAVTNQSCEFTGWASGIGSFSYFSTNPNQWLSVGSYPEIQGTFYCPSGDPSGEPGEGDDCPPEQVICE